MEVGCYIIQRNLLGAEQDFGVGYFNNTSVVVGPQYDNDVSTQTQENGTPNLKDNYFYHYGNISNLIPTTKQTSTSEIKYNLNVPLNIRSTGAMCLYTGSGDLVSKYEIDGVNKSGWDADATSVVNEIYNLARMGDDYQTSTSQNGETGFIEKITGRKGINTIFDNMFGYDVWKDMSQSVNTLSSARTALYGAEDVSGHPDGEWATSTHVNSAKGVCKDILLASARYIYTFGDIIPMVDKFNNLGSRLHRFNRLYVNNIRGDYDNKLRIESSLVPSAQGVGYSLGGEASVWDALYTKSVGTTNSYVDVGISEILPQTVLLLREQ